MLSPGSPPTILLFDGVCNLCNAWVRFVIRHDPAPPRFRFAALQSEVGKRLLQAHAPLGHPVDDTLDSVVMIDAGRMFVQSSAALRVLGKLGLPWSLLRALILVPRPLRDGVYRWVARHRYAWFGRRDSCMLPTPELRSRFLD